MYEMKWNEGMACENFNPTLLGKCTHLYLHTCHMARMKRLLWLSGVLDDDDVPYGQVRELGRKEEEADLTLTLTLTEHLNPNLLLIALTETTMGSRSANPNPNRNHDGMGS